MNFQLNITQLTQISESSDKNKYYPLLRTLKSKHTDNFKIK